MRCGAVQRHPADHATAGGGRRRRGSWAELRRGIVADGEEKEQAEERVEMAAMECVEPLMGRRESTGCGGIFPEGTRGRYWREAAGSDGGVFSPSLFMVEVVGRRGQMWC